MKRLLVLIVILLAAFSVYWYLLRTKKGPKQDTTEKPILQKKHSEAFNKSIDAAVAGYLAIKDAFVKGDTATAKAKTAAFIQSLDSIDMKELEKDSGAIIQTAQASLMDIKSNAASLLNQSDIKEMRRDFGMVTEMMYPAFFKAINYEGATLYLFNCATAFGESESANWLSKDTALVNPYLDKSMPACGELKDSVLATK
ncbi:MAG: DUF3347 domain-containing protein [Ferruginibacter sp.]